MYRADRACGIPFTGVTVAAVYDLAPIGAIIADQMSGNGGSGAGAAEKPAAGVPTGSPSRPGTAKPQWWG